MRSATTLPHPPDLSTCVEITQVLLFPYAGFSVDLVAVPLDRFIPLVTEVGDEYTAGY